MISKKFFLFVGFFLLLLLLQGTALAAGGSTPETDKHQVQPIPLVTAESALVPLRSVSEVIGVADLDWEQEKGKITFSWDDNEFVLYINEREVFIAGKVVLLSRPMVIVDGRTQVPVDFVEAYLPLEPGWELEVREKEQRQLIVETAVGNLGVPYRWGGTSPAGFDSSGLVWYVFQANDIQLPRVSLDLYQVGKWISKDQLLPGDLVFFRGYRSGPSHVSI